MHVKLAEVTRGSWVEAVHVGSVVVMNAEGELLALAGDPATQKFFRSSAKLFQALPLIASGASDAFGFTTEELALSCASHNGTERHRTIVRSMLDKIVLGETDLRCGASEPLDEEEHARALLGLTEPSTISCECSGEHAGWPIETYVELEHPLQRQIRAIVAAACGLAVPEHRIGVAISGAGGSTRSLGPAAIAVLDQFGVEDDATLSALQEDLCPPIEGFSGSVVGETRAALELQRL